MRARGAHRLRRLHRSYCASDWTDDTGLSATLNFVIVGRIFEYASETRARARKNRHRLPGHPDYTAVRKWLPRRDAGVVDHEFRERAVGRVDHKVVLRDDTLRIGFIQSDRMSIDLDLGEFLAEPAGGRFDFGRPEIGVAEDHLTREVGQFDRFGIDERQPPGAVASKRPRGRYAESANADD